MENIFAQSRNLRKFFLANFKFSQIVPVSGLLNLKQTPFTFELRLKFGDAITQQFFSDVISGKHIPLSIPPILQPKRNSTADLKILRLAISVAIHEIISVLICVLMTRFATTRKSLFSRKIYTGFHISSQSRRPA
jgi:hypothetical protein